MNWTLDIEPEKEVKERPVSLSKALLIMVLGFALGTIVGGIL